MEHGVLEYETLYLYLWTIAVLVQPVLLSSFPPLPNPSLEGIEVGVLTHLCGPVACTIIGLTHNTPYVHAVPSELLFHHSYQKRCEIARAQIYHQESHMQDMDWHT